MAAVATTKLLENDQIIVWELLLEPGERTGVHRHEHDYLVHVVEGSTLLATDENGQNASEVTLSADDTYYFRVDNDIAVSGDLQTTAVHDAKNIGTDRYKEIMVEIKQSRLATTSRSLY